MTKLKLNKDEVRGLIKEVLQERWTDVFKRKGQKSLLKFKRKKRSTHKFSLYHDLSKWEDDFLDDNGIYIGPEFSSLDYAAYSKFKRGKTLSPPGSEQSLQDAMQWNEYLAELYSLPYRMVVDANKDMSTKYYNEHPDRILGFQS